MHDIEKKNLRANHAPYMTKALGKAIMKRSQLQYKCFKERTAVNELVYKKQKHFCSRLYKKEKKKYCSNLELSRITDNKKFPKAGKPLLSNKEKNSEITLIDNDNNKIQGNTQVAVNSFEIDESIW